MVVVVVCVGGWASLWNVSGPEGLSLMSDL